MKCINCISFKSKDTSIRSKDSNYNFVIILVVNSKQILGHFKKEEKKQFEAVALELNGTLYDFQRARSE